MEQGVLKADFCQRILDGKIDFVAAKFFINQLTDNERALLHDEIVVSEAAKLIFGETPSEKLKEIAEYIRHYKTDSRKDGQLHFNSPQTESELINIFEKLKQCGYFAADSDLATWLYICKGGDLKNGFRPLHWIGKTIDLAWLVYSMFTNDNAECWKITVECFTVKGKTPKISTMKNIVSRINMGYKDKPKKIETLLKSLLK